jgi:hypothetical protein
MADIFGWYAATRARSAAPLLRPIELSPDRAVFGYDGLS